MGTMGSTTGSVFKQDHSNHVSGNIVQKLCSKNFPTAFTEFASNTPIQVHLIDLNIKTFIQDNSSSTVVELMSTVVGID